MPTPTPQAIPCYFYFHGSIARGGLVPESEGSTALKAVITSAPDAEQRAVLESAVEHGAPVLAEDIVSGETYRFIAMRGWVKQ